MPSRSGRAAANAADSNSNVDEILFLIPYKPTRPYFALLYHACEREMYDLATDKDYRLIWRFLPKEDSEFEKVGEFEKQVTERLKVEFRQSNRIKLLVVAPRSEKLTEIVASFSEKKGIPVVSVALPFHTGTLFKGGRCPPAVYTDGTKCMQALAVAAFAELKAKWDVPDGRRFNLVLVPGEKGRKDSDERIKGFKDSLEACCKAEGIELQHKELAECKWQRDLAEAAFKKHLEDLKKERADCHVVYSASDELALGVRDAIVSVKSKYAEDCIVYGFDDIPEMNTLVRSGDRHMKGTVGQNTDEMAKRLAELIDRVLDDKPTEDIKVDPLKPCLPDPPVGFEKEVRTIYSKAKTDLWVTPKVASNLSGVKVEALRKRRNRALDHGTWCRFHGITYVRDSSGVVSRQPHKASDAEFYQESLKPSTKQFGET